MISTGVKIGDIVAVDYVGTFEDGKAFDTSIESVAVQNNIVQLREYKPLEFTVGNGDMIKGFDNAVVGMEIGQTKRITIQPEDAYGNVREDLIVIVNASSIESGGQTPFAGGSVIAENGARGVITKIENGNATVDFNHPLAGKILNFEITLVRIISS